MSKSCCTRGKIWCTSFFGAAGGAAGLREEERGSELSNVPASFHTACAWVFGLGLYQVCSRDHVVFIHAFREQLCGPLQVEAPINSTNDCVLTYENSWRGISSHLAPAGLVWQGTSHRRTCSRHATSMTAVNQTCSLFQHSLWHPIST